MRTQLSTAMVCRVCHLLNRRTHTRATCSCPTCPCVHGLHRHAVQVAWLTLNVCLPTRRSQLRAQLGQSSFIHRLSLVLLLAPLYMAQVDHLFFEVKNQPGTPSSVTFFPCGMHLFCFSSGRGSPHRSLSTFLPLGRHHFPVCFSNPGCKAMDTQKLAVHVRASACAGA